MPWLKSYLSCLELNRSLLSSSCSFQTVIDSYIMELVSFSLIIRSGTYWCNFRPLTQQIDRLLSSVYHQSITVFFPLWSICFITLQHFSYLIKKIYFEKQYIKKMSDFTVMTSFWNITTLELNGDWESLQHNGMLKHQQSCLVYSLLT